MLKFLKKTKDKAHKKNVRIALMSVADILNFGDTLFPFIARQEILKRIPHAEFRFFTPTDSIIEGEKFWGYSKTAIEEFQPTAIIVIGGEVIHKYDDLVWNEMYKNISSPIISAKASDTFFDWLDYPAYKAWFSTGVLYLNDNMKLNCLELNKLDYIGVRGILSKKNLETNLLSYNNKINVIPDIGWIFNRYFTDYRYQLKKISKQIGIPLLKKKYIIFNYNGTSIENEKREKVKKSLVNFAINNDCYILLMPVIKSYNDSMDLISLEDENIYLLESSLSLKEKGSLLMGAWFYLGSSLHSAITTMANNKNAAVIHNVQLTKLQDLFAHSMRLQFLASNWLDIDLVLEQLKEPVQLSLKKYIDFMSSKFDEELNDLCKALL